MICHDMDLGNGVRAIVCTRGSRKKCACGGPASKLCDFPLSGEKAGKTCDTAMCDRCAVNVGPDRDYCQPHFRYVQQRPGLDTDPSRTQLPLFGGKP